MNPNHVRDLVVIPTLRYLDPEIPFSQAAVNLVTGTAAQESGFQHLQQLGGGPALGLWQMEPATHSDIWENYLRYEPKLEHKLVGALTDYQEDDVGQLITNLAYAAAMCRVYYRRISQPLPEADDLVGLAMYWKKFYNTERGAGRVEDFIANYKRYLGEPTR